MKTSSYRFTIKTDPDTYWKTFLDDDYTTSVYLDGLGAEAAEIQAKDGDIDSGLTRTLKTVQKMQAPGAIRKLMGETVTNIEEGSYDPSSGEWTFTVKSDAMGDKLKVSGKVTAQARDDGTTDQVVEMSYEAKMRLIGGQVEGFAVKQGDESWNQSADFLNGWLADKGLATE